MRVKNLRKARTRSPARGGQTKRQRRESPLSRDSDQAPSSHDEQPKNLARPTANEATQPPSWDMIMARISKEPVSQIQAYKDWRRSGSTHKEACCICHTSEKLSPCHTCSLVFHSECMPAGWVRNSLNQLFCSICVDRKWDRSPPVLTPPMSPRAQQAQPNEPVVTTVVPGENPTTSGSRPDHGMVSLIDQTSAHNLPGSGSAGQMPVNAPSGIALNSNKAVDANNPEPKRRQRKSRYSTLAADVDLALATIYREVESIPLLRTEVEDLRADNAQQSQTIKIYEQNLIALRREIERLKTHATNSESVNKELSDLRERNSSLEAELQLSMQQSAAAKELKERLAQLLSN